MADRAPDGHRRELQVALLLVLLGAGLVLLSARQHWVDVSVPQAPPLPARRETRSGGAAVPGLAPLGLLGLAGLAALAATRRTGRVLVGGLLVVAGALSTVLTARALARGAYAALDPAQRTGRELATGRLGFSAWPVLALVGGVLLLAGGALVAARGRQWARLSERYDAPAARRERAPARPEVAAWEALDRGEDPTAAQPAAASPASSAAPPPARPAPAAEPGPVPDSGRT